MDKQKEVYDFIAFLKDRDEKPEIGPIDSGKKLADEARQTTTIQRATFHDSVDGNLVVDK